MANILIVEDESLIAMLMGELIAEEGHSVVGIFPQWGSAMQHLDSADVAILDISLKDGPVFPLARELSRRGIPFFFASGAGGANVDMEGFEGHPSIIKPFHEDEFKNLLRLQIEQNIAA